MFEYDEATNKAAKVLDEYDLTDFLSECGNSGCTNLLDIQEKVVEKFGELETVMDDMTSDEFMEYLCKRYNVKFAEEITYRMYGKMFCCKNTIRSWLSPEPVNTNWDWRWILRI